MSLKHIFELNLNSKNEVNKIELKIKDLDNTNLREKQTIWFFWNLKINSLSQTEKISKIIHNKEIHKLQTITSIREISYSKITKEKKLEKV